MAKFTWNGGQVTAKVTAATKLATDKTMSKCVADAKANHPAFPPASEPYTRYANRTGFETGAIYISEAADYKGTRVTGRWGAFAEYALFLEIGTSRAGPTAEERAAAAQGNMDAVAPPIGPLMAPRPFLRPAADKEYPKLGARIGAAYRGLTMP